jgi:hypothetical protein
LLFAVLLIGSLALSTVVVAVTNSDTTAQGGVDMMSSDPTGVALGGGGIDMMGADPTGAQVAFGGGGIDMMGADPTG